jgi:hydroxyacylglutathione hydrolase
MAASLQKLAALPGRTVVYCTHEYTMANLRFAAEVEPGNSTLIERMRREQKKRDAGQPTLPSTIALELATNPFLRSHEPEIVQNLQRRGQLEQDDGVAAFAALRLWKNTFR